MARRKSIPRHQQAPAPRESTVLSQCLAYLSICRIPCWRLNTGALPVGKRFVRFGVPGSADILGVIPPSGRALAVEVKRPGGRISPTQVAWLDLFRSAGGLALVVHSIEELRLALREIGIDAP